MADFNSPLYVAQLAARSNNAVAPNSGDYGGPLHYRHAKITLTGSVADADIFNLMYLPKDAKVVPAASRVQCSADPGTTLVLDVGISTDTDLFADGIILSAGGSIAFDSLVCEQAKTPTKLTDNTLVYATVPASGANTVTNAVTLTFWIAYTLG